MTSDTRVVVIGLDGASWKLLKPWVDMGELPTLEKLMKEGAWGELKSLELPISSASWSTITTGVGPGRHGVFDFSTKRDGEYVTRPLTSRDVDSTRVWDMLGADGKECYAINVPMTYPPGEISGAMVSGFPSPEANDDFTYPRGFIRELRAEVGEDIHFRPRFSQHDERRFIEEMEIITDYVKQTTEYILENKSFDFLMSVFVAPDALGHTLFKYLDENHPNYTENETLARAYLDAHVQLDNALSSIIDSMDDSDMLLLVSDHGFTSVYYAVALNKWLMEKGYLHLKRTPGTTIRRMLFRAGLTYENAFKLGKMLGMINRTQETVYSQGKSFPERILNLLTVGWNDIDWSRTVAYSQGNFGQIFVNLEGREPKGVVAEDDYDQIVDRLVDDLIQFERDGERVFDTVVRGVDVYSGPYAGRGPDVLCLHSASKYIVSRFFEFGSNKTITVHPMWSGTHDRHGIFLAWDRNGKVLSDRSVSARVEDVTPTVLHAYDISSDNLDGSPLTEVFRTRDKDVGEKND